MAWPHWVFSSILSILKKIIFVCFLPSMHKWNNTFSFLLLLSYISVSKASLVFTQLKLPISVFSNTLTCSASAGKAMHHLLFSLWTQPPNQLAELHFLGFNLKRSYKCEERGLNISHNIMVSWKLYILLNSPKFSNFIVWENFSQFHVLYQSLYFFQARIKFGVEEKTVRFLVQCLKNHI